MLKSSLRSRCRYVHFTRWGEESILQVWWEPAPFSKVISDGRLVEPFSFVEELSNIFWRVPEQLILHQKHDALQKDTAQRPGEKVKRRILNSSDHEYQRNTPF